MALFRDRTHAGDALAEALAGYSGRRGLQVLALPRGGVPVAFEVARTLAAPLDVIVVRKLGVPGHEELAMGAVASGGGVVLNEDIVSRLAIPARSVDLVIDRERAEVRRREAAYRGDRPPLQVTGATVVLVDDGIATGATLKAALLAVREAGAEVLVAAAPVGARDSVAMVSEVADEVVCLHTPPGFGSVGEWYEDFSQTTDAEVRQLLDDAARG